MDSLLKLSVIFPAVLNFNQFYFSSTADSSVQLGLVLPIHCFQTGALINCEEHHPSFVFTIHDRRVLTKRPLGYHVIAAGHLICDRSSSGCLVHPNTVELIVELNKINFQQTHTGNHPYLMYLYCILTFESETYIQLSLLDSVFLRFMSIASS